MSRDYITAPELVAMLSAADRRYVARKCAEKIIATTKSPDLKREAEAILDALGPLG